MNWTSFCDPKFKLPCSFDSSEGYCDDDSPDCCRLLVKQWRCEDKKDDGKLISKPETDATWPFGYKDFFELGARYRFRV